MYNMMSTPSNNVNNVNNQIQQQQQQQIETTTGDDDDEPSSSTNNNTLTFEKSSDNDDPSPPPPPSVQRSSPEQLLLLQTIATNAVSGGKNDHDGHGRMINVDNIFNAILDDAPPPTTTTTIANTINNSNYYYNVIPTYYNPSPITNNNTTPQQQQQQQSQQQSQQPQAVHRQPQSQQHTRINSMEETTQSIIISRELSKSMGTTITTATATTTATTTTASAPPRHAGYLLKRSNDPYVAPNMVLPLEMLLLNFDNDGNNSGSGGGGGDVEEEEEEEEPLSFTVLPFGGVVEDVTTTDDLEVGDITTTTAPTTTTATTTATTTRLRGSTTGYIESNNDYDDDDDSEGEVSIDDDEDQCFCAPIVQLFTGRRRRRNDETTEHESFGSPIIDREDHPQQQRQLHEEVVAITSIPLKGPARSDPVPISPRRDGGEVQQQQPQQHFTTNSAVAAAASNRGNTTNSSAIESSSGMTTTNNRSMSRLISRSYSNGSRLNETSITSPKSSSIKLTATTTTTSSSTATNTKEYPPPPPDYISRDGHIWRAKYCVLEEGILYFYRNAMEGESNEAQAERNESRNIHTAATTGPCASPIIGLSTSPSLLGGVPIPINSMVGRTSTTAGSSSSSTATTTVDYSSSTTSLSKMGKKDLFDLSKSPMPMKKSDYFFDRRVSSLSSSLMNRSGGDNAPASSATTTPTNNATFTPTLRHSPMLHHSNSTGTFHHDADILWEKRVALDCVGAVRSSVQEHGDHAFELLAYGSGGVTNDDEQSSEEQQQHEIIDRLILRAGSSDDMNTWMFQFHRSLASYMQQIVNSALNNRQQNVMRMRPDSPVHQLRQHRRIGTPVGGNNNATGMTKHNKQQASSPMGSSSFGSGYSPSIGPSLSHGHGRNAIYRRQVREGAGDLTPAGVTPAGSPVTVDTHKPSIQTILKSDSIDSQKKAVGMMGLRDVRKSVDGTTSSPVAAPAARYIPPHMRRKMEAASKGGTASLAKQIPLNDSIDDSDGVNKETKDKTQTRQDDGTESDTPSDSALSTTSSLLRRQLDDASTNAMSSSNVRRGGCADPTVILGSILDHIFIPRKASFVGKSRLTPHGCVGGGFFTSMRCAQVEEEDSIPFDDVDDDVNNSGSRTFLSGLKWEVGASSECGVRDYNEDSYVAINNLDEMISSQGLTSFSEQDVGQTKQQGLFAIFDGHVGNQGEVCPLYIFV